MKDVHEIFVGWDTCRALEVEVSVTRPLFIPSRCWCRSFYVLLDLICHVHVSFFGRLFPHSAPDSVPKGKRHHPMPGLSLRNIALDQDLRRRRPCSSGREISSGEEFWSETVIQIRARAYLYLAPPETDPETTWSTSDLLKRWFQETLAEEGCHKTEEGRKAANHMLSRKSPLWQRSSVLLRNLEGRVDHPLPSCPTWDARCWGA